VSKNQKKCLPVTSLHRFKTQIVGYMLPHELAYYLLKTEVVHVVASYL